MCRHRIVEAASSASGHCEENAGSNFDSSSGEDSWRPGPRTHARITSGHVENVVCEVLVVVWCGGGGVVWCGGRCKNSTKPSCVPYDIN